MMDNGKFILKEILIFTRVKILAFIHLRFGIIIVTSRKLKVFDLPIYKKYIYKAQVK